MQQAGKLRLGRVRYIYIYKCERDAFDGKVKRMSGSLP